MIFGYKSVLFDIRKFLKALPSPGDQEEPGEQGGPGNFQKAFVNLDLKVLDIIA